MSKEIIQFSIMGKFDSLNKLIGATNHNRYVGASIKKRNQKAMATQMANIPQLPKNATYTFNWHLSDKRQDPDNISTAVKYFFDALQELEKIPNDNWEYVHAIRHNFFCDTKKTFEFVEVIVHG